MELQGLGSLKTDSQDLLMDRTFGGCIRGTGFEKVNTTTLKSIKPVNNHHVAIYLLTTAKGSVKAWRYRLRQLAQEIEVMDMDFVKSRHEAWWQNFWNRSWVQVTGGEEEETGKVSLGWHAHRYLTACGARGEFPVKFNGSIFNMDGASGLEAGPFGKHNYDADYRAWGGEYWFQNQRQIYWPMLAAGDYEMMLPLFRMYADMLPMARKRTELYYNHKGVFFPETLTIFGTYANFGYGWDRKGKKDGDISNEYIKYHWQSGLELSLMMLEYYKYTNDAIFLREMALPLILEVVSFYSNHWPVGDQGKFEMEPAHALETFWGVKNPLPEIAGMKRIITNLLALPLMFTTEQQREQWHNTLTKLPDLPMQKLSDGKTRLAPAGEVYVERAHRENVIMYAVFPYRLFGVGRDDLELGRRSYMYRDEQENYNCWANDNVFAAFLGLPDEARKHLADRFVRSGGHRYPAFYTNGDWVPDLDNGGVCQQTIQAMLLQSVDDKIYLFPAWPKEWDVDFKLHAAGNTILEAKLKDGKLEKLVVIPKERKKDVIVNIQQAIKGIK
jgi:hypothetical protein